MDVDSVNNAAIIRVVRNVETVSISLAPRDVVSLEKLARTIGSRSAAVRQLLKEHEQRAEEAAIEKAYREYYSDPKAVAADLKLTDEMLQIATWPGDEDEGGKKGGRRKRSAR